ncbi:hypothetical protein L218DRAFT_941833 [Marasmius fiardii PR-910]|nr:hypothetical protein L218DRAFT_941833 [Marasmius fiardii PR-910]
MFPKFGGGCASKEALCDGNIAATTKSGIPPSGIFQIPNFGEMSAPFHIDRPVAEFAAFYAKLQPLLANFAAQPRGPLCDQPHSSWILTEAEKEIMMVAKVLDVNFSAAEVAKIFYPSLNRVESTEGQAEAPPTVGPVPDDTSLPATRSRVAKGKGKAATSTPPPLTSQKSARKPCILESEDDQLDQLETSPKTKPSAPSSSGKPNTGRGKTGGPRAKPKDPLASSKDKKACSPSPERAVAKPNKKSKKTINITAPPPETSSVPKWGDPRLKLPGKWPKGQEGLVEQDPDNLVDSKPHIHDDVDPKVYEGAEDVSSTIALPSGIRASLASLAHGATSIRFTGPYSRSLPCTECYEKPQECTGPSSAASKCDRCAAKRLSCSNNLPENSLNAFLEVAVQNRMTSQTMIERLLTEIDFHWEQIFDLDQAILHLERLKKKTITAHDIAQDTLKASCQDPHRIIHLLKTTDASFKMTPAQGFPRTHCWILLTSFLLKPGDAQVAMSSNALHHRPVNLGGGIVITEQPEAASAIPPPSPFTNADTLVVGMKDQDTSLSEEGEIQEVLVAEESA